jgi:hypothetical protein
VFSKKKKFSKISERVVSVDGTFCEYFWYLKTVIATSVGYERQKENSSKRWWVQWSRERI